MPFQVHAKKFADLKNMELYQILKARNEVFVVEQNCVYQDADDYDQNSWHVWLDHGGGVAAYCRVLPAGAKYPEWSIGRVLTCAAARGQGAGHDLMKAALSVIDQNGGGPIRISAQSYLRKFYEGYGFQVVGDEYHEDNIPHLEMVRTSVAG